MPGVASIRQLDASTIDYTPTTGVAAGDVVVQGSLVGIADRDIAANTKGALVIGEAVVRLPCATGATGAVGSTIRWYAVSGVAHATTGTLAGYLALARAATDTTVEVFLWPNAG